MLRTLFNKSWKQHPTEQQLYGHLSPISKTIQVRQTRYAEHCLRSKDELISDVLLWTPSHGPASVGRPRTYLQHLCTDTGGRLEDLPGVVDDSDECLERVREIHASCATWTDKMKRSFFQAAVVSILLYGSTTGTLTKRLEKKLDGNYTRMLRAILN